MTKGLVCFTINTIKHAWYFKNWRKKLCIQFIGNYFYVIPKILVVEIQLLRG